MVDTGCLASRRAAGEGADAHRQAPDRLEAKEWGLVNDSAPAEDLDDCVERFVATLADKSPFQDMSITKIVLNRSLDADTDTLMVLKRAPPWA